MTIAEQLLQTQQASLRIAVEHAAPRGWKAGRTERDGETTVTTSPYGANENPEHAKLMKDNGFDPARYRIIGPIRNTSWTAYIPNTHRKNLDDEEIDRLTAAGKLEEHFTFRAKAYRFTVVERGEGELSIDELIQVVNGHSYKARHALGVDQSPGEVKAPAESGVVVATLDPKLPYVVAVGDTQIGKLENPIEELLQRTMDLMLKAAAPARAAMMSGYKLKHIHLPWLGDCIEGMNSQGGRLRWRTVLTVTEQVRILRRLMLWQVELFAPLAEKVTILAVPGNHDEANARDLDTRIDDSWAIEALNGVADSLEYNREAFGHVEAYVPGADEQGVVMEVGNTIVGHIHGHTHRVGKHFEWWAGQTFGGQDYGRATLLLQGHEHHFQVDEDGFRKWLAVPALESESVWWKTKTGTGGSPGIVTFQLDGGSILNLNKLEPKAA